MDNDKIQRLICSCCGAETRGRQWHNRDTGYGLCDNCINFVSKGETPEYMRSCYGEVGVHYKLPTPR